MGRKNRRNPNDRHVYREDLGVTGARRESRTGKTWNVRDIPAHRAQKIYVCPACPNDIPIGQAHVVVWDAEDFFGDDHSVGGRRHWHTHCWRMN